MNDVLKQYIRESFVLFVILFLAGMIHGSLFTAIAMATNQPVPSLDPYILGSLFLGSYFLTKTKKVSAIGVTFGFFFWGMVSTF